MRDRLLAMIKTLTLCLALCAACAAPQTQELSPATSDGPTPELVSLAADAARVWAVPDPNTNEACRARRVQVAKALGTGALVVSSGPEVEGRFSADPHFFWMTAVNIPDIVLVLEAADGELVRESNYVSQSEFLNSFP